VAAGVDQVEFDVQRTLDGVPAVIHDETLDRTTSLHGRLDAHDWATLHSGAPDLPSLDTLCVWARPRTVGLMLELKQPDDRARDDGLVPAVLAVLRRHSLVGRTVVISFDHLSLGQLHRLDPDARAGFLYGRAAPDAWPGWASGIHAHHTWVTPELCARAHAGGQYVHAWGFEPERATVERLVSAGVDSLSADDPRRLVSLLR
jgi:glycerophosphoryl diester phosphodiesterase